MQKMGRPYPKDFDRKMRVMHQLFLNRMTQDQLADAIEIQKSHLSEIIWGIRRSPSTENRIAEFFGVHHDALFPKRTIADLMAMKAGGKAA